MGIRFENRHPYTCHTLTRTHTHTYTLGDTLAHSHVVEKPRTHLAATVSQFPLSQHLIEFYCKLKKKILQKYYNCKLQTRQTGSTKKDTFPGI